MEMKECNIKATAILVGYVSEAALAGKRYAPEKDFADLLARITSSNPKIRGEAKDRIVELARRGGYYLDDTRPHGLPVLRLRYAKRSTGCPIQFSADPKLWRIPGYGTKTETAGAG